MAWVGCKGGGCHLGTISLLQASDPKKREEKFSERHETPFKKTYPDSPDLNHSQTTSIALWFVCGIIQCEEHESDSKCGVGRMVIVDAMLMSESICCCASGTVWVCKCDQMVCAQHKGISTLAFHYHFSLSPLWYIFVSIIASNNFIS